MSTSFNPLRRFDTELTACSVEILPDASRERFLACGLYQNAADPDAPVDVESPRTKRTGRLLLYRGEDEGMHVYVPFAICLSRTADG